VIKLSQLLRYILYQTDRDTVPLGKEVEHLKDYIELQQMRLENNRSVRFICEGETNGKLIVPLLFIPIVENFFKHGDFSTRVVNELQLQVRGSLLIFRTVNVVLRNPENKEQNDSGIGLGNVRRRLALHYPDKHMLRYSEQENIFTLEMEILLE
jgi:LytS/YehU family sensor histidine kinase